MLRFLQDSKLRTEQLRYLNLQRCKGLRDLRSYIESLLKKGVELDEECPPMPEIRNRSIRVSDLRYEFDEPPNCKWCGNELTPESLALTFDLPIEQGGSPEIENVVAICKRCFFLKGIYPQQFWAKLINWLMQEGMLEDFRRFTATWARKAAYKKHWAARRRRGVRLPS